MVSEELKNDIALKNSKNSISVIVQNGIVAISGWVDSCNLKLDAQKAAFRIPGVMAVMEDLEVKLPGRSRLRVDIDWTSGSIFQFCHEPVIFDCISLRLPFLP
jgi:hypothetical protein